GCYLGFSGGTHFSGTITIENSYFDNVTDVTDRTTSASATQGNSSLLPPHKTLLNNDIFVLLAGMPSGTVERTISMRYIDPASNGGFGNLIVSDQVFVTNYNGVAGDNFQVYYAEQAADFILPQTNGTALIGSPEAGLTNAQNWLKYGIALAG